MVFGVGVHEIARDNVQSNVFALETFTIKAFDDVFGDEVFPYTSKARQISAFAEREAAYLCRYCRAEKAPVLWTDWG